MKNLVILLSFLFSFLVTTVVKCANIDDYHSSLSFYESKLEVVPPYDSLDKRNENVLAKTFLLTNWLTLSEIHQLSYKAFFVRFRNKNKICFETYGTF
jgi:hypothetical protein